MSTRQTISALYLLDEQVVEKVSKKITGIIPGVFPKSHNQILLNWYLNGIPTNITYLHNECLHLIRIDHLHE